MSTITVAADHAYPVVVNDEARLSVNQYIAGADRVAIIHAPALRTAGELLRRSIEGATAITIEIPDAERAKTHEVVEFCWKALGESGFTRNDVVVSLGGGATTDLAGFVAATWLRGVRLIHVPTTLLAMVDAAVGGKTGINTAQGKNLVGAFYSPQAVLCDLSFLRSQIRSDYVGGLAEVIKAGFIRDPIILELIESDLMGAQAPNWWGAREVITRAISVKADVVGRDMRETAGNRAGREILNYGHTLGHAIERLERYQWRHGEAVSVGMVFAAELAQLAGRLDRTVVGRHRTVLQGVGLPTSYTPGRFDDLLAGMRIDKKSRGDRLRFIILEGIAEPDILESPDLELLREAYQRISEVPA